MSAPIRQAGHASPTPAVGPVVDGQIARAAGRRLLIGAVVAVAVLGGLQLAGADLAALVPRSALGVAVVAGIVAALVGWSALARLFVPNRVVRGAVVLLPALALLGWLLPSLVVDRTVQEDLPGLVPPAAAAAAAPSPIAAAPAPSAVPPQVRTLGTGALRGLDGHQATGTASLLEVSDGVFVRVADLDSTRSPDVRVWLVPAGQEDPSAGGVELGPLKGNRGSSNYEVPAGTDLEQYGTVLLWCRAFSTAIGAADLAA